MLHSRARRADDRISGGEREGWWWWQCDLESDTELLAASGGSREMSIRFLGYFVGRPISRFLYRYLENWAFQISSQFFPPSRFSRLHFDCTSWPAPRPPSYFSHYFSGSPPPLPLLLLFAPPAPLLFFLVLARSKRFYTRAKSRLSYLASLLGEDLSCGTLAASRRGCRST